jgi:hypothetical protein
MNSSIKLTGCVLGGLLLLTACKSTPKSGGNANVASPTTSTASTSTASTSAFTAGADPRADLTRAMTAVMEVKSYRSRVDLSSEGGPSSTLSGEFVAPDRFHMIRETAVPGHEGMKQEMLVIGKQTFMKNPDGKWETLPVNVGDMFAGLRDKKLFDSMTKDAEVKFIGPDSLDGAPMLVYEYKLKNAMGTSSNSTSKVWISTADGLPRKSESDAEIAIDGKATKTHTTSTYSDYNADISIEAPEM